MTSRIAALPGSLRSALSPAGHTGALLRGTAGSFLVKIASNALLFASQIVFARFLGVDGFGLYVLALAWLSVLVLFGRAGFDLATVRYVAAYRAAAEWGLLRGFLAAGNLTVLAASLSVATLFAGGVALSAPDAAPGMARALLLAALIMPPLALVQVQAAAMRGLGHVVLGDVPHSLIHPGMLLVCFLAAIFWFDAPAQAETALWSYTAATAASLLCLWPMLRARMRQAVPAARREYRWREWLTAAPAMLLIAGFAVALNQSTVIMTGALSGTAEAGLFGAAARVAGVLQIITFSLVTAIGPMIARLHAKGEGEALQTAIDTGVRTVFLLGCAAAAVLAALGGRILSLFGEEFAVAHLALLILLAGQTAWAATAAAGSVLNMTGHQNASAVILAVAAAANLGLCWLLIPPFGLEGAAAATAATMAGSNIAMAVYARRAIGLRSYASLAGGNR